MFEALRQAWHKAVHPFEGFLDELWTIWQHDVGRAVLTARRSWQSLPEEVVQQAAAIEAQSRAAQQHQQIMDIVKLQMQSIGASPGSSGSFGFMLNPDQALFLMIMGSIRLHHGNPPTHPAMVPLAADVLGGHLDPVQALVACMPPIARPQAVYAIQVAQMTGMGQLMRVLAVIQAANALPEDQIDAFLPAATQAAGG
jgi:hypothetical protein